MYFIDLFKRRWDRDEEVEEQGACIKHHNNDFDNMSFSPDGTTLFVKSKENEMRVLKWRVANGGHAGEIVVQEGDVAFTSGGLVGIKVDKRSISIWEIERDTQRYVLETPDDIVTSVVSSDGRTVAFALVDRGLDKNGRNHLML